MTRTPSATDPREAYLEAVCRRLARSLHRRHDMDVDDIVQAEAERLWQDIDAVMEAYPNPATYATVRSRHAAIQWDRGQHAQRGEGSRLITHPDRTVSTARTVVSGHTAVADDGTELFSLLPSGQWSSIEDEVVDRLERERLLQRALLGMSARDRAVLFMVDGLEVSVTEVAAHRKVARETLSRRVSKLRGQARLNGTTIVTVDTDTTDDAG